jgi:hypothetical protein
MASKLRTPRRGLFLLILTAILFVGVAVPIPGTSATPVAGASDVLWSANHEAGNLNEWSSGGGGGLYNTGTQQSAVSTDQHHTGTKALKATISTSSTASGVRAFRWNEPRQNRDAFYSTWVYLPQQVAPTGSFMNLFQFVSRTADGSRVDPAWAFYGAPDGKGGTYLKAGWGWGGTQVAGPTSKDGVGGKWYEPAQKVSLPVGRWVHLQASLHQSSAFDGRLVFWQDGVKLFDLNNVRTSYKNCNYNSWCADNEWSVNLFSDKLSANPATMYIDDAVVSRSYVSDTSSGTPPTTTAPTPTTAPPTTPTTKAPGTTPPTTAPPTTAPPSTTPVSLPGTTPPLLWSANHDAGNTNEWSSAGGGGLYNSGTYEVTASTDQHRSGSYSLRERIWTPGSSGVRAFRWKEARENRDAYYSAWIYLPQNLNPTSGFLNMFQFKSRTSDGSRIDPIWGFYGVPDGKGGTYLKAGWGWGGTPIAGPSSSDGVGGKWYEPAQKVSLPVGRWVHLEAFLHQANGFDGKLQFWQDGVKMFDLNNIRTSFNNCDYNSWCADNEWSMDLYSDGLTPNPATLYVDDAAIARSYIP